MAQANEPDGAERPVARAATQIALLDVESSAPTAISPSSTAQISASSPSVSGPDATVILPVARNVSLGQDFAFEQSVILFRATRHAPRFTPRPIDRPDAILVMGQRRADERARGALCGDLNIQGEVISRIPGRISGCGIENPVRVRSISGVVLTQLARMDCTTARALREWVDTGAKPAVGNMGGGIANLRVVAEYACRTRNNLSGAKISEHGRGRAIDIAGIGLRDGSEITVLTEWNSGAEGRVLHQMHRAACGPFGTVLGPDANRFHRDHFHFDTARYRSGSYCR